MISCQKRSIREVWLGEGANETLSLILPVCFGLPRLGRQILPAPYHLELLSSKHASLVSDHLSNAE